MLEKQFLLNQDGTYPNEMTKSILDSLSLIPVLPTQYPQVIENGYTVKEVDPVLKDGVYVQQWEIVIKEDNEMNSNQV